MGAAQQLLSIAVLSSSLFVAPGVAYFLRGALGWRRAGLHRRALYATAVYSIVAGVVLGSIASAVQAQFSVVAQLAWLWVGLASGIYVTAYNLHHAISANYNLERRRFVYVLLINGATWSGLALAYTFYSAALSPEFWVMGIALGFGLSSAGFLGLARRRPGHPNSRVETLPQNVQAVLFFAWPQAITYLLWWGQSQTYRFILEHVAGLAFVGLYAVAAAVVAQTMQTLKALFDEYYAPKLFGDVAHAATDEAKAAVWNSYMSAYGPAMILFGLALFGSVAFWPKLLLGAAYQSIALVVIWPIAKETIEALSSTLWTLGIVKADMRMNILPVAVGAVLSPVLVTVLAPIEPLHGTGIALVVGAVAVFAIIVPVSLRSLPVQWPIKRFFQAFVLGSPLVLLGIWTSANGLSPSIGSSLGALAAIAAYVIGAQWLLSRSWLATFDKEALRP